MKTKFKGKVLAIMISLSMAFSMMLMMSGAAFAVSELTYVEPDISGDGSGLVNVYVEDAQSPGGRRALEPGDVISTGEHLSINVMPGPYSNLQSVELQFGIWSGSNFSRHGKASPDGVNFIQDAEDLEWYSVPGLDSFARSGGNLLRIAAIFGSTGEGHSLEKVSTDGGTLKLYKLGAVGAEIKRAKADDTIVANAVPDENYTLSGLYLLGKNDPLPAGNFEITSAFSNLTGSNYTCAMPGGDTKIYAVFTSTAPVTKTPLTIKANDQRYTYNKEPQGPRDITYSDSKDIEEYVTVNGLASGDKLASVTIEGQGLQVGEYQLSVTGCMITDSEGVDVKDNYDITYEDGVLYIEKGPTEYDLWIGGTQVTSANASDIPGGHSGKASYDAGSNTLTLSSYKYSGEGTYGPRDHASIIYHISKDLTVKLVGDNELHAPDVQKSLNCGIQNSSAGYAITFTGAGSLSIVCGQAIDASTGIYSTGNVVIDGPGLDIDAVTNGRGIDCGTNGSCVVIKSGSLTAKGTSFAIYGAVDNKMAGTGWTDYEGRTEKRPIRVYGSPQILDFKRIRFPEVSDPANATTVPTAKDLTANGSAQELVTAGEAEGGEMQYALGTDAVSNPTSGWSTAVPTGTDPGDYYVWYKIVGDSAHIDSTAACVKAHIHGWKDATCTEAKTCTECGLSEGEPLGHTEVVDKAVEPTCTEAGKTEGKHCSVCDEVLVAQEEVSATGHTEVVVEAVEPTCTEAGKTEGKHCSVCNEVLVEQKEVPATGHTEVVDEAVEPSCTEAGKTEGKHCSVCNEVLVEQKEVPATGHTEVIDPAVDPTCTESGLTEGKHCSVCNEVLVEQKELPATGHSWDEGKITKEPTVDAEGEKTYTCTVCKETRTEPIEKLTPEDEPEPTAITYSNISGGGTWTKGSKDTLGFTFKRSEDDAQTFNRFKGIDVDGNAVPEKDASGKANWTAKSGSVIIELQPTYLETLSVGKHTLTVNFDDGSTKSEFTIKAAETKKEETKPEKTTPEKTTPTKKKTSPKTGDESNMLFWLLLMATAYVGAAVASKKTNYS